MLPEGERPFIVIVTVWPTGPEEPLPNILLVNTYVTVTVWPGCIDVGPTTEVGVNVWPLYIIDIEDGTVKVVDPLLVIEMVKYLPVLFICALDTVIWAPDAEPVNIPNANPTTSIAIITPAITNNKTTTASEMAFLFLFLNSYFMISLYIQIYAYKTLGNKNYIISNTNENKRLY